MLLFTINIFFILVVSVKNLFDDKYSSHNYADVTLIGAHGDLAKKYLWNAMFHLNNRHTHDGVWTFNFNAGGLKNSSVGKRLLKNVLPSAIICPHNKQLNCKQKKKLFIENVSYFQLKDEQDYAKYCSRLYDSSLLYHCHKGYKCQYQHIFYLSVPSFTYQNISSYIAGHCRPMNGTGSLKVVFEKPFGHSRSSANSLAKSILQHLEEKEIYRVDHYLGKQAIQEILPFRKHNKKIEKMLNDQYLERIEIVMKETLNVKGRTSFYDKYGVIADVMNNHLSEILYLLTMDLPINIENTTEVDLNKLKLVKQIQTVKNQDVVVGQYQNYQNEVLLENHNANKSQFSATPTFAGVKLKFYSSKWDNLLILMIAGKMMKLRTSYARLIFKENTYSLNRTDCSQQQEIIFHIGYGSIGKPALLISKSLPLDNLYKPKHWSLQTTKFAEKYLSTPLSCYQLYIPDVTQDAYVFLLNQVFLGHQEHFLRLPTLLESWRVWGPVIEDRKQDLKIYPGGNETGTMLDFSFNNQGLSFLNHSPVKDHITNLNFLGHRAVFGKLKDILHLLAQELIAAARVAVEDGRNFHIALSGGSSPYSLFDHLAIDYGDDHVWRNIHVWQVDERCSLNSSFSNFKQLSSRLLDKLSYLRYSNVHPMLIESSLNSLCREEDAALYEKWIKIHLSSDPRFDFVILGMGSDGHTASLFPRHKLLKEKKKLVAVGNNVSPHVNLKKRMTMTLPLINHSKKVAIIVTGMHKCAQLRVLKETHCNDLDESPICGVSPDVLSWFVDNSCDGIFS